MAVDFMADDDDGDWKICWDFERNDWGSGWKSSSSWAPGPATWQAPRPRPVMGGGDGPFAGDAGAPMPAVTPWWDRSGYAPQASKAVGEGPYMGDGTWHLGSPRPLRVVRIPHREGFAIPPPPPHPSGPSNPAAPAFVPAAASVVETEEQPQKSEASGVGKKPKRRKERRDRRGSDGGREDDISSAIDGLLSLPNANLQKADFDSGVRRYLGALRGCPNGPQKVKDAMAMLHTYTSQKSRSAVKNWPAYLLTLLKRFEPGALNARRYFEGKGGPRREDAEGKGEQDGEEEGPQPLPEEAKAPEAAAEEAAAVPTAEASRSPAEPASRPLRKPLEEPVFERPRWPEEEEDLPADALVDS